MQRPLKLLMLAITFGLGIGAGHVLTHLRAGKTWASWSHTMFHLPDGHPGQVTVHVRDSSGRPMPGIQVGVEDTSARANGITDAAGQAILTLADSRILNISVNHHLIARSNFLCHLNCAHGLEVFYQPN